LTTHSQALVGFYLGQHWQVVKPFVYLGVCFLGLPIIHSVFPFIEDTFPYSNCVLDLKIPHFIHPERPGRHTCYNGRDKGLRPREGKLVLNLFPLPFGFGNFWVEIRGFHWIFGVMYCLLPVWDFFCILHLCLMLR
jgi:hypothetical protein